VKIGIAPIAAGTLAAVGLAVASCAANRAADDPEKAAMALMQRDFKPRGQATLDRLRQDDVQRICSEHADGKLPAAQIRDLAALRWLQAGESVILHGPVGVGKTHIAQALAHQAIRAGVEARFAKTSRVLAELAGGHADGTWTHRLRELARPAVLVLDDFAMRELTPAQADDLYELINERAGRSLILTSNRTPIDWYPLFPNPVVAESLLDRLINNSHQLLLAGASYRPRTRPGSRTPRRARSGRSARSTRRLSHSRSRGSRHRARPATPARHRAVPS